MENPKQTLVGERPVGMGSPGGTKARRGDHFQGKL